MEHIRLCRSSDFAAAGLCWGKAWVEAATAPWRSARTCALQRSSHLKAVGGRQRPGVLLRGGLGGPLRLRVLAPPAASGRARLESRSTSGAPALLEGGACGRGRVGCLCVAASARHSVCRCCHWVCRLHALASPLQLQSCARRIAVLLNKHRCGLKSNPSSVAGECCGAGPTNGNSLGSACRSGIELQRQDRGGQQGLEHFHLADAHNCTVRRSIREVI